MATATAEEKKTTTTGELPFGQLTEQSEELLRGIRKASAQYVDFYESAVNKAISIERRIAAESRQDWIKTLVDGHANFASELTEAYVSTARKLIK